MNRRHLAEAAKDVPAPASTAEHADLLIYCPRCGSALMGRVTAGQVDFGYKHVYVNVNRIAIEHECTA